MGRRETIGPRRRIDDLRTASGFLRGLRPFLARPLDLAAGRRRLERQLAVRERAFAYVLARAVFENPASPYLRLFEWAGVGATDVVALLADEGVEGALERLYEAGVYVTLEEFKGARPLHRPGLDLDVRAEDFDNPLASGHYEARTGGSTGAARPILVNLDLLEHESAYHLLFFAAAQASERPLAIWEPAPPGAVGIKMALIRAKLGRPAEKWFSQTSPRASSLRHSLFTKSAIIAAGRCGVRIPPPEYAPPKDAGHVAAWLAASRARGTPAVLIAPASSAVRACAAAMDGALDITETIFILGGEPYTAEKAAVVAATGSRVGCHYAMAEAGLIGLACLGSDALDDVHLMTEKIATIQRDRGVGSNGRTVGALFHTTLLPVSPKLMLNVESGDYGVREERDCGCGALPKGFRSHLHTIRSYEKLTSEGMSFLGGDLLSLLEDVLPRRFGGHPTDYQLVEREEGGLPKVSLVVSRSVGELDQDVVARTVLEFLGSRGSAEHMMVGLWAQSRTLEIVRGDPHVTPGGKILPLQLVTG